MWVCFCFFQAWTVSHVTMPRNLYKVKIQFLKLLESYESKLLSDNIDGNLAWRADSVLFLFYTIHV